MAHEKAIAEFHRAERGGGSHPTVPTLRAIAESRGIQILHSVNRAPLIVDVRHILAGHPELVPLAHLNSRSLEAKRRVRIETSVRREKIKRFQVHVPAARERTIRTAEESMPVESERERVERRGTSKPMGHARPPPKTADEMAAMEIERGEIEKKGVYRPMGHARPPAKTAEEMTTTEKEKGERRNPSAYKRMGHARPPPKTKRTKSFKVKEVLPAGREREFRVAEERQTVEKCKC